MGAVNSTALEQHNCTGYGYNLTGTNLTEAPLTDAETLHADWIAEFGWIVAVCMALAGCIINNLGSNVQKLAFRFGSGENRNIKCIGVWASGFMLQILGATLDMVALGYGDQSLIAPIAALALVANIGFARCIHQEDLSCLDGVSMGVIFLGCVVCTISAGKHNCPVTRVDIWNRFISFEYFWGYAIAITCIMVILGTLQACAERMEKAHGPDSVEYGRLAKVHRVGYPIMAGVIGAQSVLIGNAGVTCITEAYDGIGGPWQGWEIFLFILFTVVCLSFVFLQVAFLNRGLERWDAMLEVPIMQSIWIVFCIIGGGVFFEEFASFELWQFFVFPLGVVITLAGVGLLAYFRRKKGTKKVVPGTSDETAHDSAATDSGKELAGASKDLETGSASEPKRAALVAAVATAEGSKKAPPPAHGTDGKTTPEEMEEVVGTPVKADNTVSHAEQDGRDGAPVVVGTPVASTPGAGSGKSAASKKHKKKHKKTPTKPKHSKPGELGTVIGSKGELKALNTSLLSTPEKDRTRSLPSTPSGVEVEVRLESKLQTRAAERASRKAFRRK
eukprot:INCI4469.1.p1 GENE.INCI4469.1~~INCI4469.1.p1  ORF type:complete len:560 (-),score=81.88 INCI4469.1:142-1821(-)